MGMKTYYFYHEGNSTVYAVVAGDSHAAYYRLQPFQKAEQITLEQANELLRGGANFANR
jgi:hypothetical protein